MGEFVKVASASEIAPGQARLVNIKGKEIALFNIEGSFFALDNACTHEEGPLAEGDIEGHEVTCPWHGAPRGVQTNFDQPANGLWPCRFGFGLTRYPSVESR